MVGPGVISSVGFEATIGHRLCQPVHHAPPSEHRESRVELPSVHQLLQFLRCEFLLRRWLILAVLELQLFQCRLHEQWFPVVLGFQY